MTRGNGTRETGSRGTGSRGTGARGTGARGTGTRVQQGVQMEGTRLRPNDRKNARGSWLN